jgi:hypothetical protein
MWRLEGKQVFGFPRWQQPQHVPPSANKRPCFLLLFFDHAFPRSLHEILFPIATAREPYSGRHTSPCLALSSCSVIERRNVAGGLVGDMTRIRVLCVVDTCATFGQSENNGQLSAI